MSVAQYDAPLMEDALYSVLFPKINKAIEKQYGSLKPYQCPKIISLKKCIAVHIYFKQVLK